MNYVMTLCRTLNKFFPKYDQCLERNNTTVKIAPIYNKHIFALTRTIKLLHNTYYELFNIPVSNSNKSMK